MLYFKDRTQAGQELAGTLKKKYASVNCAVLCLSDGGVLVGAEIAKKIHASLYLLMTENIKLPGENDPLATMSSEGTFTYNNMYSAGQLEGMAADYMGLINQERLQAFQKLNRIVGKDGEINKELLKRHVVILVSDGFSSGLSLAVAADFLKPIETKKIVVAAPIASVEAIDKMHALTDEIFCLGVTDNFMGVDHYYENNEQPEHKTVVDLIKNIVLNW